MMRAKPLERDLQKLQILLPQPLLHSTPSLVTRTAIILLFVITQPCEVDQYLLTALLPFPLLSEICQVSHRIHFQLIVQKGNELSQVMHVCGVKLLKRCLDAFVACPQ